MTAQTTGTNRRPIGYTITQYWCRKCAPEGVRDYYAPMRVGDDYGVPYHCDVCEEPLTPCEHEWGEWHPWYAGGEFRTCDKDGCGELERPASRSRRWRLLMSERAPGVRVTLSRCKAENVEPSLAAADGRCRHWTFGADWHCPFHMDAGTEPFVMVSEAEVERLRAEKDEEQRQAGMANAEARHLAAEVERLQAVLEARHLAAEVERLQAVLKQAREERDNEREILEAEVARRVRDVAHWSAEESRLRRALERIADDDCGSWDQAMRFARVVLLGDERAGAER